MHTTKKSRGVFNIFNAKTGYIGKTRITNSYSPQLHVNRFDSKHDLHEFTCNRLHFIQLHATQSSWNSQKKTKKNSFHIHKYQHTNVSHHSHNRVFLFLMNTCQATIHTQPRSSNIFVQHGEDIMTQHSICKDTNTSNYVKPRMRNTSQHELNTKYVRQIIPAN